MGVGGTCVMGNQGKLVIMNFSGIYEQEEFYKGYSYEWMDCADIQGTNCYCDDMAEMEIKARIEAVCRAGCAGVHFLDSGNYHYLSKIWLDMVKEDVEVLVFDHHMDMQPPMFGDILSCGGWIKAALDSNPRIKRVWLAGSPKPPEEEMEGYDGRVVWVSEGDMTDMNAWKQRLGISSLPLYISVDKDVLGMEYARTNWDQGDVELSTVLECISTAASCRFIAGVDVCGENPDGAGEERAGDISINDRTNRELVCHIMGKCGIVS